MLERFLGLDLGDSKVGLALSDQLGMLAHPFKLINFNGKNDLLKNLKDLVEKEKIAGLVIGLPYNKDGSLGKAGEKVKKLSRFLSENLKLPLEFIDERFTSQQANTLLQDRKMNFKQKKELSHQLAAALILQSFLDQRKL